MKNSSFAANGAVALSLAATLALLCQPSTERPAASNATSVSAVREVPETPDEIITDLAGHAWLQLESSIRESVAENDTLVVWLVDRSVSMSERRLELADRLMQTFRSSPDDAKQLKHALVTFAAESAFLIEQPTTDANRIATHLQEISGDPGGEENVMQAVQSVVDRYQNINASDSFSGPNRIIVISTDERGDDLNMVDQIADVCSKQGFRVFCLGNASPFGAEKGFVRMRYADGFQADIPVNQGPETIVPQILNVPLLTPEWKNDRRHGRPFIKPIYRPNEKRLLPRAQLKL